MSRYLLVLACSEKKDPSPYQMKALDRYDGVNFRVLKKLRRERILPENLDIVIISAKYGLLDADEYIDDYDMRMTPEKASHLHAQIMDRLKELFSHTAYEGVLVNLGKDYLPAIAGIENCAPCPVGYAQGRIGEKMRDMKTWVTRIPLKTTRQKTLKELNLEPAE
jgi:hypothetical protein